MIEPGELVETFDEEYCYSFPHAEVLDGVVQRLSQDRLDWTKTHGFIGICVGAVCAVGKRTKNGANYVVWPHYVGWTFGDYLMRVP